MKIKISELQIDQRDPFKHDALERRESAEILSQLISHINEPTVIAIDAGWGQGKTTFIKMWKQSLMNTGYHTLYFNAWECDFSDDAMAALVGEIELGMKTLGLEKSVAVNSYWTPAKT